HRRCIGNWIDSYGCGCRSGADAGANTAGGLHVEAKGRARAEQICRRRESKSGIAFCEGDEIAVIDWRSAVVLEQRAVRNVRDLELRDLGAINGIATDDETGCALGIF